MAKLDSAWGRMETSITTTTMSMLYLITVHVHAHAHIHCVQQMIKLPCGICKAGCKGPEEKKTLWHFFKDIWY